VKDGLEITIVANNNSNDNYFDITICI